MMSGRATSEVSVPAEVTSAVVVPATVPAVVVPAVVPAAVVLVPVPAAVVLGAAGVQPASTEAAMTTGKRSATILFFITNPP